MGHTFLTAKVIEQTDFKLYLLPSGELNKMEAVIGKKYLNSPLALLSTLNRPRYFIRTVITF